MTAVNAVTAPGDDVLLARAYLSRVAEPASVALWLLVREVGPVEAAARVRARQGITEHVRGDTEARAAACDPEADLATAERLGLRLVVPESAEWPHFALMALEHSGARRAATFAGDPLRDAHCGERIPPLALWAAGPGDLAELGLRSVGIVGSRRSTAYGEHVAQSLARGVAERDVTVVSGGAFGIDKFAHLGALEAHGVTVLVSAGGLDRAYPPSHASLFRRVRESGLLLSESPPGAAPKRQRVLTRNRLIASLSTGTVVVEAASRSGALNTLRHSVHIGRPVMAVPGPVGSPLSAGCHEAIRTPEYDATLVSSVDEVLEIVGGASDVGGSGDVEDTGGIGGIGGIGGTGGIGGAGDAGRAGRATGAHRGAAAARAGSGDRVRRVLDALDDRSRAVFDGFPAGRAVSADELVLGSGLSASEVLRSLPVLELAGLIEQHRDGFRIRR